MTDAVHEMDGLVYGVGKKRDAVHGFGDLVYGTGKDGCRTRIGRFGVRDGLKGWERKTRAANELAARVWVIYIWSGLYPCP